MQSSCEIVLKRENSSVMFNGTIRGPEKSLNHISAMKGLAAMESLMRGVAQYYYTGSHIRICV